MDRKDTFGLKPYVMQNGKYQSCTYHLSSASRLTRAINKAYHFYEKCWRLFWENSAEWAVCRKMTWRKEQQDKVEKQERR